MGRLKDRLRGASGYLRGGRMQWADASARHRCPVCSGTTWCQVSRDGAVVLCKRCPSDDERENAEGATYWVHRLDGSRRVPLEPGPSEELNAQRAPPELRDAVYRALLAALPLEDRHRAQLVARGLDTQHVAAGGYASLALGGRARIARALLDHGLDLAGVPGFYVARDGARTWWSLAGAPGLLVPVRDLEGCIVAVKVRRDDAGDGPKYLALSSRSKGGPSAENAVHVPVFASRERGRALWLTEGELKADAACVLGGLDCISIPGVGAWRSALPIVRALAPSRVVVALDADGETNPHVAAATHGLLRALRAEGFAVAWKRWDAREAKGLDDLLLTRRRTADATRNV